MTLPYTSGVPTFPIRVFGDPGLKRPCKEVPESEWASMRRLADDMITTMYEAPGVGLAANQIGVLKRLFVYDVGEGPHVIVNPTISESRGEWEYEEGCLSVPGLAWEIVRPKEVHLTGFDLVPSEEHIDRRWWRAAASREGAQWRSQNPPPPRSS